MSDQDTQTIKLIIVNRTGKSIVHLLTLTECDEIIQTLRECLRRSRRLP